MASFRRGKFPIVALSLQVIFIVIFGLLGKYDKAATAKNRTIEDANKHLATYPMFQDVHVMIFIGFGFLMTFLKRYGYSAIAFNLLIAAFVLQWAIIVRGIIHQVLSHEKGDDDSKSFGIGVTQLLTADFAAATVLISFGAVLGKTSPLQLLIMALLEVVMAQINEWIGYDLLKVHIQNATLAGGVAVGTTAHMPIQPWGAALIGSLAGLLSVFGYKYLTPCLSKKLKIHDTCGVNNLHGMPGIFAGIVGAIVAAAASYDSWGYTLYSIFPAIAPARNSSLPEMHTSMFPNIDIPAGEGRSGIEQGGYQMLALVITLVFRNHWRFFDSELKTHIRSRIYCLLLRAPIWDNPKGNVLFDDQDFFEVAEDGFPLVEHTRGDKDDQNGTRM
ncbi:hypothetical protein KUTeg_006502 [Tegillarca granosa]|uniref:Ammonium transporter AmtB-like domain-containing protein n=1 Tax=Tegillarca granosa TaxID=220873 RepID=A0ABQ9FGP2_TEGGR|nr:hypothetical protein KUTeg_006502 [Tegillarca granosa]